LRGRERYKEFIKRVGVQFSLDSLRFQSITNMMLTKRSKTTPAKFDGWEKRMVAITLAATDDAQ
jgi:hypothetical protein